MNVSTFPPARWAVSLVFAVNGFLYASWISRLPRLQEIYHIDHAGLGLVLLSLSLGALIGMPITGAIIVRMGSRRVVTALALLFCLVHLPLAWMGNIYGLGALTFLIGMISGSLDVSMNAQAILVEERMNRPVMSSFHAFFSGGMMIGAGAGALFVGAGIDVAWHLAVVIAMGLVVMLWCMTQLLDDPRPAAAEEETTAPRRRGIHPALISLGLVAFCCMLGEGAMADWSTNFMEKVTGASRSLAPLALAAFSAAMTGGRIIGDQARLRLGDHRLLRLGSLLALGGVSLAILLPVPALGIAGFFLVGLGLSTIVPIAYSTAGTVPGLPAGLGISMVSTVGYTGFLIGPPVIGFLSDWWGLRLGLGFVAILFLLMVVLTTFRARRQPAVVRVMPKPAIYSEVSPE